MLTPMKLRLQTRLRLSTSLTLLALSAGLSLAGCTTGDDPSPSPEPTPTATPAAGGDFASAVNNPGGATGQPDEAPSEGDNSGDDGGGERTVEEADILAQDGNNLYVLNMYRGLMVLDVTNPDKPRVRGRVPITGYPVEMYVREGRAYVVVSNYYYYWRSAETDSVDSFHGSMLAIIDVSNPDQPGMIGKIDLEGYVSQTRAVGDVIYAVSNRYASYSCDGTTDDTEDSTYVVSVDISDPANPTKVDSLNWPGSAAQVHATSHSFYVIEPDYVYNDGTGTGTGTGTDVPPPTSGSGSGSSGSTGSETGGATGSTDPTPASSPAPEGTATPVPGETPRPDPTSKPDETPPVDTPSYSYLTHVTYVDISDAHGILQERDSIDVDGQTWDKNALNEFNGTFRLATQKYDGKSSGTLTVLDVSNPDDIQQLSSLDIVLPQLEYITASRFDGERGYVVTAQSTDPLFVMDLSNPAQPRLAGHVVMPGQLQHLETLGDRIVAFGQDNSDAGTWRFAVSLFDVSDMDAPTLLDREIIGDGGYSWSNATWDDKSFTLLPDEGLIAVPFTAYDENWAVTGGVQLLDFDDQTVTVRGMVSHPGYVTRVRPVNGRLASLSDTNLLMINDSNRDKPSITADLTLTDYVTDYLPMGDIGVQLVTPSYYWYSSTTAMGSLRLVDNSNPDELNTFKGQVEMPMYDGQLVRLSDSRVGLLRNAYDASYNTSTTLDVYDIRTAGGPVLKASLPLPSPVYSWASSYSYYYGSTGGALVQGDGVLAYLQASYYYYGTPVETEDAPKPAGRSAQADSLSKLYVIDVRNPDAPSVASLDVVPYLFNLKTFDGKFYATHSVNVEDNSSGLYLTRYYLDTIDVSDPANPVIASSVNVPGVFQHLLDDGKTFVTLDSTWNTYTTDYGTSNYIEYSLKGVQITNGRASVVGTIPLSGYSYSMMFQDDVAYMIAQDYYWMSDVYSSCGYNSSVRLDAISLDFSSAKPQINSQAVPTWYGYLRPLQRNDNLSSEFLFVDTGYDGLLLFDVSSNPEAPAFVRNEHTSGYVMRLRGEGDMVYLPLGMYGVETIDLGAETASVVLR